MDCKASIAVQSTYNFKVAVFFNVSQHRCTIELQVPVNFNRKWYATCQTMESLPVNLCDT